MKLFRLSRTIQRQLNKDSPGLVGYSLNAKIFAHKFWTLSVWENQSALTDFVLKNPHKDAMNDLRPSMGETKFAKWAIKGANVPPTWQEVFSKLSSAL